MLLASSLATQEMFGALPDAGGFPISPIYLWTMGAHRVALGNGATADRQRRHFPLTYARVLNGTHSAGVWAALRGSGAGVPSRARRTRPVCKIAAMMAPTIGAVRYSQASLKLPVATIGPSARAGLKGAPVRAPPMRMLKVSVIT